MVAVSYRLPIEAGNLLRQEGGEVSRGGENAVFVLKFLEDFGEEVDVLGAAPVQGGVFLWVGDRIEEVGEAGPGGVLDLVGDVVHLGLVGFVRWQVGIGVFIRLQVHQEKPTLVIQVI